MKDYFETKAPAPGKTDQRYAFSVPVTAEDLKAHRVPDVRISGDFGAITDIDQSDHVPVGIQPRGVIVMSNGIFRRRVPRCISRNGVFRISLLPPAVPGHILVVLTVPGTDPPADEMNRLALDSKSS